MLFVFLALDAANLVYTACNKAYVYCRDSCQEEVGVAPVHNDGVVPLLDVVVEQEDADVVALGELEANEDAIN